MVYSVFPMQSDAKTSQVDIEPPELRVYTPEDFIAMYDTFAPRIYRHAISRVGERKAAEDIASQVFLNAWEYFGSSGKSIENTRAFLYHIAHNLITDHYRKKKHETVSLESLPEHHRVFRTDRTAHGRAEEQEVVSEIERSLGMLAQEYRDMVVWRYVDELSIEEIVALSGKSSNAVYVTIHRAIKKLRAFLVKKDM